MWKSEELFLSSREYFSSLIDSCAKAKESIDIEVYIFIDDEIGQILLLELQKAARRKVKVKILVSNYR
ncbi:MAG: hypothetical protein H7A23_22520 [Leptospiraceae bacterium]|nr:hypothetical protein [Leptospiraceae bacterium]